MTRFILIFAFLVQSTAFAAQGTIKGSFSNNAGSRSYQLFLPSKKAEHMPLFVVLHGCFQSGDNMIDGTALNEIAEKEQFAVLYPEQTYGDNSWKCWNWFKPENLTRDTGEASIVAGMTRKVIEENSLDKDRVFVSGISAGAAFASDLMGCYSDIFSGVMVHSGMEYAAARTEDEAHEVTKNGSSTDLNETAREAFQCSPRREKPISVFVIHGLKDPYVNPINADRVVQQFLNLNHMILPNVHVVKTDSRIEQGNHRYSANVTDYALDGDLMVRKVAVEEMGHGWSGGRPTAPYMEPRGVDASRLMVDFFLKHK